MYKFFIQQKSGQIGHLPLRHWSLIFTPQLPIIFSPDPRLLIFQQYP